MKCITATNYKTLKPFFTMSTRNTTIRSSYPLDTIDMKLTEAEIDAYVKECLDNIRSTFHWEYYPAAYTHLVVCVRYENTKCNIYTQGWLMDDYEFETKIAARKDLKIESVLAYHRGTSKF